jgi:hypothetical protein
MEYLFRLLAGGVLVSGFAVLADILRPKSFAGLFGAAPSVAVATLGLAFWKEGGLYVSTEGRSMIIRSLAFTVYGIAVCSLLLHWRWSAVSAALVSLIVWLTTAVGSELLISKL